jgi:hypothetical protein
MEGKASVKVTSYMPKIFIILIFSFFLPMVFSFLSGVDMWKTSAFSSDKLVKLVIFYIAAIALLAQRSIRIRKDIWMYLVPAVAYLLILGIHYVFSEGPPLETLRAKKELVRMMAFVAAFFFAATVYLKSKDYRLLIYCFAFLAIFVGIFSTWHSMSERVVRLGMQVGDFNFIRAGVDRVGTNRLGAVLNLASLVVIAGFFVEKKTYIRVLFLAGLIIAQIGRFMTFSTGSFLNIVIALMVALFMLWIYEREIFRKALKLITVVVVLFVVVILISGTGDLLFYRLMMSDDIVLMSSVYSRINLYAGFLSLVSSEPGGLLFGFGTAELPSLMGTGDHDIHNSYLRPLAAGGIIGFLSFLVLYGLCFRNFILSIRSAHADKPFRIVCIFFFAAFMGWSIQAGLNPSDTGIIMWFFFIFAYSLRSYEVSDEGEHSAKRGLCAT